jgi:YD repeat-containing protein
MKTRFSIAVCALASLLAGYASVSLAAFDQDVGAVISLQSVSLPPYAFADFNGNGIPDAFEDFNGSGIPDAFEDFNGNGIPDAFEMDFNNNGIPDVFEYGWLQGVFTDFNGNGVPDAFEDFNGSGIPDAFEDFNGSGIPDTFESQFVDTTGTGIPDFFEVVSRQTLIPWYWLAQYGLSPYTNPHEDANLDWLTNYEKYLNDLNPLLYSTDGNTSDYVRVHGRTGARYYYDANDRLVGVEYQKGRSIAYAYDEAGRRVREVYLERDQDGDGLPDIYEFLHDLDWTNGAGDQGRYGDASGSGWSNYQEWQLWANSQSIGVQADVQGVIPEIAGTFSPPFTAIRFTMAAGRLHPHGDDVIVVGADGNPAGATNELLILSQAFEGWTTQRVAIGSVGVTSIAIGQPTNAFSPAIFIGTRSAIGTGGIARITKSNEDWNVEPIYASSNHVAHILGVRPGRDVLVSLATDSATNALSSLSFDGTAWQLSNVDTNPSQRGLGIIADVVPDAQPGGALRLIDTGGIQYADTLNIPSGAVYNVNYGAWFMLTDLAMNWANAQAYAQGLGGNLVTINSAEMNSWIRDQFLDQFWIGLYSPSGFTDRTNGWIWASGSISTYRNWASGEPNNPSTERHVHMRTDDQWNNLPGGNVLRGLVEVPRIVEILIPEPPAENRILWAGRSLASGVIRGTNASVFYLHADDKNENGLIDAEDALILFETEIIEGVPTNRTHKATTLYGWELANTYSLAVVDLTKGSGRILFTAEPDGGIYSWSAPSSTGALVRNAYSLHHEGTAWHDLAAYNAMSPGEGLAGLNVDPANPNEVRVVTWQPAQELWTSTTIPQTAPITRVLPDPGMGYGVSEVAIRVWDAEGNVVLPFLQYQNPETQIWMDATILSINGQSYSQDTRLTALPTGSDHMFRWYSGQDLGTDYTGTVNLRTRSVDVSLWGDWSVATPYYVEGRIDSNEDGLPDAWKLTYGLDPLRSDGGHGPYCDPDEDGVVNIDEWRADTNPMDGTSYLAITGVRLDSEGLRIEWQGGIQAWQRIQARSALDDPDEDWETIHTIAPPTPTENFIIDAGATGPALFYRIEVERAP